MLPHYIFLPSRAQSKKNVVSFEERKIVKIFSIVWLAYILYSLHIGPTKVVGYAEHIANLLKKYLNNLGDQKIKSLVILIFYHVTSFVIFESFDVRDN